MLKAYMIKAYGYLVKVGAWDLEPADPVDPTRKVVAEEYREAVAAYLVTGVIA